LDAVRYPHNGEKNWLRRPLEIPNFTYRDSVQDVRTKLKKINDLINHQKAEI